MPPSKRRTTAAAAAAAAAAGAAQPAPAPRASKLAKEHGINGSQEAEIKEAFALFKDPQSPAKDPQMPTPAVRSAFAALNLSPSAAELRELLDAADPESEGFVSYEAFLAVAALRMMVEKGEHDDDDDEDEDDGDEDDGDFDDADMDLDSGGGVSARSTRPSASKNKKKGRVAGRGSQEEVEQAFRLFTGDGHATEQGLITFAHLKRIAKDLKLDVKDELLRNMMREASGTTKGVSLQEFEDVMKRAGVFR